MSWELFDNSNSPSEIWDHFEKNVVTVLDRMCPVRTLTVPESKPDWLTNDILQLMRKRDNIFKDFLT